MKHPPVFRLLFLVPCLLAAPVATLLAGENLFKNPGFENGEEGWKLSIPTNVVDPEAKMTITPEAARSGEAGLAMSSSECIRYSVIGGRTKPLEPLVPGERFRISLWIRAGKDFVQRPNTVGFCVRVSMGAQREDNPVEPMYFGLENHAVRGNAWQKDIEVPQTWTKISFVFEILKEVEIRYVDIAFMVAEASGTLYLDDVSLERVPETTPLTPLFSK